MENNESELKGSAKTYKTLCAISTALLSLPVLNALLLIICALAKFALDYLRMSHVNQLLSANQLFCIVTFAVTIFALILSSRKCANQH